MAQADIQTPNQPSQRGSVLLTQDSLLPGIIKERHLVAGAGANTGDLVYSNTKGGFANLGIGATGNLLWVKAGVPAWLANGTAAQVLTMSGGIPTWATPAASGNTVNLYTNSTTTGGSTASTTFVDIPNCVTGSVTTTKTANILLTFTTSTNITNTAQGAFQIVRGSTVLSAAFIYNVSGAAGLNQIVTITAVDASLAAGTYTWKVQFDTSANTITANPAVITALVIQ